MYYPLISLIIPIYNSERYLHHCIASIINQSYQSLEIILINDGSTDNSLNICQQLQKQDSRIKIINQENKGASIARLEGIKQAKGEFLIFVDSDDIVEPDYVEQLYNALQKHHTMIAACGMIKHTASENVKINKDKRPQLLEENELHKRFFNYELWGFGGKIYHKSVFTDIYFPKATINEDYVVMAQLFLKHKRISFIDIPLYHYLIHNNESLSNTRLSHKMMDEWTNKLWVYQFYQKNNKKWLKHAEAQVAETCCKLIHAIGSNKEFYTYKRVMQSFLKQHFIFLLFNPYLVKGIKLIIGYRMIQ